MPDRTLLIPGTQASTLVDQDGAVVYNAVRVSLGLQKDELGGRPPSEWQRLLSIEQEPGVWEPSRTSLEPGTEIRPDSVVETPYERMLAFTEPWPYDWRMDIRHNATLLLEMMRAEKPADGRFNLIGHSQGGLVIVLASKLTTDLDEFSRLVARTILVGAPLAGSMRATEALLWGREDLGEDNVVATRGMALTWPAIYQMMPSWNAVVLPDERDAPEAQQFMQPGGWPGPWAEGVQEDLLLRARETEILLHGPFSRFGSSVLTMAFLGKRQMTPVLVTRTGDVLPADRRAMRNQQGDSLVPAQRTLDWGGSLYQRHAVVLTGRPEPHAMLCQDEEVVSMTRRFLDAPAPPPPSAP
jgi:pimeloyl-ACP methyl ester carboxylesterase